MEDGESSSPRHAAPTGLSASPILPAILQRTSAVSQKHQQSSQANVIQLSADSHPGLHAPAALRPTAMSAIPLSNHNQAAAQYSDGPVPLAPHLASGIGRSMSMGGGRPEPLKRKRGRPRKYAEGSTGNISLSLSPRPSAQGPLSPTTEKRRGRPPGSGRKQQLAALGAWIAGSAGQGFTPHVITIATGEDVATKIMSFSQIGPRAVCVLSANGAISNVTLRQPATSGGTVTYEVWKKAAC
ncbi:hypothetical protein O6H91_05G110100 [Diphasiastrum complanatum]|uniref:Uncharacterized protein n=1 Tax=Diphasiastrum complanatum TaxID=34168 RepID=A0ACC2DRX0_DIPCM|nr:hypothetical protein O6H91_05G110100 [Diphasiastrum complanatum]